MTRRLSWGALGVMCGGVGSLIGGAHDTAAVTGGTQGDVRGEGLIGGAHNPAAVMGGTQGDVRGSGVLDWWCA